jgi:uncharacterized protein involved in exopolysaccharide biosynthesis
MDTIDRPDPNVPARYSADSSRMPVPIAAMPRDLALASTSAPQITPQVLMRGLSRHWWRIMICWMVLSIPLAYGIYALVEPTYEAMSLLRAEPSPTDIYNARELRGNPNIGEVKPYLLTQVQLITSDSVLDAALAKPTIANLATIRSFKDPKSELRRQMKVQIVGENTYLIQVGLGLPDAIEAAAIVNSVVEAYMEQHARYHQGANRSLKKNLENERDKLASQIETTTHKLTSLVQQGNVSQEVRPLSKRAEQGKDGPVESSLRSVSDEQFKEMTDRLIRADFELMDAQARLDAVKLPTTQAPAEKIREAEAAVEEAQRKRTSYRRYLAEIRVASGSHTTEQLHASLLNQDLQHLRSLQEVIKSKLAQIEFEISQEVYRVSVNDKAAVPKVPSNNRRVVYMAVSSVGVLLLILGLYFIGEVKARHVADPNAAS